MRRPLAVFGGSCFFASLLAVWLLPGVLFAAVVAAAVLFLAALVFFRRALGGAVALMAGALLFALVLRAGYDAIVVRPVDATAGQTLPVTARVLDVEPGYGGDTVHATLQVLTLADEAAPHAFRVQVHGIASPLEVGQRIGITLRFYAFTTTASRQQNYAKNHYIGASPQGSVQVLGTAHTLTTRLRQLQYAASANIASRLPRQLSSVAAAMSVGDRRFLSADTKEAYRMAGLSHVLVVSGLHLSILCTYLYAAARRLFSMRAAAVLCMAFTLLCMVFTGLSPSIIRSGFVFLLVYAGALFRRKPDIFTSLGLAMLVLIANPYACNDVGLQLSFAATLGAVQGGRLQLTLKNRAGFFEAPRRSKKWLGITLLSAVLTPVCVVVATLPVLIWSGLGTSLFTIPMNILAVPLVAPIVLCGLVMALPPAVPVLGWLGLPAGLLGGALLALLRWLTGLCAQATWAWVPLGGLYGLVVVLAVYLLVFAAFRSGRPRLFGASAVLLAATALALSLWLSAGTVHLTLAGGSASPSLVVTSGGQAVVLYRSRQSIAAISRILRQQRVRECVLWVDMRRTAQSTEYESLFAPATTLVVEEDVLSRWSAQPMENVSVSVGRQGGGAVACVDIAGYKVGLVAGSVTLQPYAPLDVLLAGGGTVSGSFGTLLTTGQLPEWLEEGTPVVQSDGDTALWIRPGKSVVWKEAADGIENG
ncbi:MAG: ComEC/Rec2 family competence protein [Oscillospiraceae bacterium]